MKTTNMEGTFAIVLARAAWQAKSLRGYWEEYQAWDTECAQQVGIGLELDDHLNNVIAMLDELVKRYERNEVSR